MGRGICAVPECAGRVKARGWCSGHYERVRRRGTTDARPPQATPICSVGDCEVAAHARGWCKVHYLRWRRHGDPLVEPWARVRTSERERFWSKVDKRASECWEWNAALNYGYGVFRADGGSVRAHRYAYECLRGPIPDGLVLDHLCCNKRCVNPSHLEPVTQAVNLARARAS